jgi:hypothetical protein
VSDDNGEDPHFPYGKEQVYPGGHFEYHLRPFQAAIAAGVTQVMPYDGQPIGTGYEEVGFSFSQAIVTGLLRDRLPLRDRPRLYVEGVEPAVAAEYGEVVTAASAADVAILRLDTPYEPRPGIFESFFHAGRLDFAPDRLTEILALLEAVPTIVAIHLERAAVIPEIAAGCAALLAGYGASDRALLDVLFGRAAPGGRLPFRLPRSMAEVEAGQPDTPQESPDPLYPFGAGLSL